MATEYKLSFTASDIDNKLKQVGQLATSVNTLTENNKTINATLANKAPVYSYSNTDITAGTTSLATGTLHFVYE